MYDAGFYDTIRPGVIGSAQVVVDRYLTRYPRPSTVLDVGGGEGWWGAEFERHGAAVTLVEPSDVNPVIEGEWLRLNLEHDPLPHKFDLAVCLEVAEHLNNPTGLIDELCHASDRILFSAAIPGQTGEHHVSCRWQREWASMFEDHSFGPDQSLAFELWADDRVEPWYRQNLVVYTRGGRRGHVLDVVHPLIWSWAV